VVRRETEVPVLALPLRVNEVAKEVKGVL